MEIPRTLIEAIKYFSDEQTCINAVAFLRWQDGSPVCPKCNATQEKRNHYWLAAQKRWKCHTCRKQRIGLNRRRKWDCFHIATAMCLECSSLYSLDEGMIQRSEQFSISTIQFQRPVPSKMELFPENQTTPLIQ